MNISDNILYHWEIQYRLRLAIYNAALISNSYI